VSEKSIQEGIQSIIQSMTEFEDASVVINDWSILDYSSFYAPFVIIENSDQFESRQDGVTPNTVWQVPINLFEVFSGWEDTLTNFRARRQAIIDKLNTSPNRAAALTQVTIDRIYPDSEIEQVYSRYLKPEEEANALPVFLVQRIILEAEEY